MQSNPYSCQVLIKLGFSRQIFEKYSNIIFHENPWRRADGKTDMEKLIVAFRYCANAPENVALD